jgi:sec-independent protein translocase protein TatC
MFRRKNKERRMSLGSHLRELRVRLTWSALYVFIGSVIGWFLFDPVFALLQAPLIEVTEARGIDAVVNFGTVVAAFDLRIQLSVFFGVVLSAPFWLYHLWAFIAPGLKAKEKRYATGFVIAALPLFLIGTYFAWTNLPRFVVGMIGFTPEGSTNVINAAEYVLFAVRVLLLFGISFVMPVVLVVLNFAGILTGQSILKSWRVAVLIMALLAALATPAAEPMSMLLLMIPLTMLYFAAVGVAMLNDKRRSRKLAKLVTDEPESE